MEIRPKQLKPRVTFPWTKEVPNLLDPGLSFVRIRATRRGRATGGVTLAMGHDHSQGTVASLAHVTNSAVASRGFLVRTSDLASRSNTALLLKTAGDTVGVYIVN